MYLVPQHALLQATISGGHGFSHRGFGGDASMRHQMECTIPLFAEFGSGPAKKKRVHENSSPRGFLGISLRRSDLTYCLE